MKTIKIRNEDVWDDDKNVIEEITLNDEEESIYKILAGSGATWTSCECCSNYEQDNKIAGELAKEIY